MAELGDERRGDARARRRRGRRCGPRCAAGRRRVRRRPRARRARRGSRGRPARAYFERNSDAVALVARARALAATSSCSRAPQVQARGDRRGACAGMADAADCRCASSAPVGARRGDVPRGRRRPFAGGDPRSHAPGRRRRRYRRRRGRRGARHRRSRRRDRRLGNRGRDRARRVRCRRVRSGRANSPMRSRDAPGRWPPSTSPSRCNSSSTRRRVEGAVCRRHARRRAAARAPRRVLRDSRRCDCHDRRLHRDDAAVRARDRLRSATIRTASPAASRSAAARTRRSSTSTTWARRRSSASSGGVDAERLARALLDNPHGNGDEQTPIVVLAWRGSGPSPLLEAGR